MSTLNPCAIPPMQAGSTQLWSITIPQNSRIIIPAEGIMPNFGISSCSLGVRGILHLQKNPSSILLVIFATESVFSAISADIRPKLTSALAGAIAPRRLCAADRLWHAERATSDQRSRRNTKTHDRFASQLPFLRKVSECIDADVLVPEQIATFIADRAFASLNIEPEDKEGRRLNRRVNA